MTGSVDLREFSFIVFKVPGQAGLGAKSGIQSCFEHYLAARCRGREHVHLHVGGKITTFLPYQKRNAPFKGGIVLCYSVSFY